MPIEPIVREAKKKKKEGEVEVILPVQAMKEIKGIERNYCFSPKIERLCCEPLRVSKEVSK